MYSMTKQDTREIIQSKTIFSFLVLQAYAAHYRLCVCALYKSTIDTGWIAMRAYIHRGAVAGIWSCR